MCRTSMIVEDEEEDRISNLPDDIIHHILGFLDMKYAIQTSKLSRKWKYTWTSMPHLNLNGHNFGSLRQFSKFVTRALSHRNNTTEVSTLNLAFAGVVTQLAVKSIVIYAYLHNIQQLTVVWSTAKHALFPQHFFSCHTLKRRTLVVDHLSPKRHHRCDVPKSAWDFPVLETMYLGDIRLADRDKSVDLFSKCVKLKDLTLNECSSFGLETFVICAPQLSNLTITGLVDIAKVFEITTPQLKNLTLTVTSVARYNFLELSPEGIISVEKVKLSFWRFAYQIHVSPLLDLFQKFRSAEFLILDAEIIETLSSNMDKVSQEPCPFNNLKCLKINTLLKRRNEHIVKMPIKVINYLLENSPNATLIIDLPQVPPIKVKRPMQPVYDYTMPNKVAKSEVEKKKPKTMTEEKRTLDAKIQKQEEVIAEQNAAMMEAAKLEHEKSVANIIKCEMSDDESGNKDYKIIRLMGCDIKSIIGTSW